jgi:geranylgeranyl pyrophosphate synthase
MQICSGELTLVSAADQPEVAERAYFEKTQAKTSALLQICTAAGAVAGNLSTEQAESVDTYARELGIAFQIVDDLLDYVAEESVLGKPTGSDLREGTITLPLLRALRTGDDAAELLVLATKPDHDTADIERVIQLVRRSSALQDVWHEAHIHAGEAINSLKSFVPSSARERLEALCEAVVATR